jgi:hypothetical protein
MEPSWENPSIRCSVWSEHRIEGGVLRGCPKLGPNASHLNASHINVSRLKCSIHCLSMILTQSIASQFIALAGRAVPLWLHLNA